MPIRIKLDPESLAQTEWRLRNVKNGVPRALVRALNDTSNKAKTVGIQEIKKDVNLTSTFLRGRLQAAKDTPAAKATFSRLESRVFAEQRGLRMTNFLTTEPGVTPAKTRIKPVGRAKSWPSAFFLKLRNTDGKLGLFVRKNGKLKHIYGPSASQVFTEVSDEIAGPMQQFLIERLDKTTADVLRQYSE